MAARLWWGVGLAMVAGILVSAFALSDLGAPLTGAPPDELVVVVTNTGSHAADFTVDVAGLARWVFTLDPGGIDERRHASPPRAQLPITLTATWSAPADGGQGTHSQIADGRDCPDGRLLVRFRVDTSRGIAVGSDAECS